MRTHVPFFLDSHTVVKGFSYTDGGTGPRGGGLDGVRVQHEHESTPSDHSYLKGCHREEELHRFCETPSKDEAQEKKPM